MKKATLFLAFLMISASALFAQSTKGKAEVLYFKANLACCKAKACNVLEADVKSIVEKNYPKGNVVFKVVKIAEESNKALVEKYQAVSQTVIVVKKKKKNDTSINVTDIVKNYMLDQNKETLEKELIAKIDGLLK
ncbi:MAG TPA: hypothetical protein PLB59_04450 [Bacteroidales bacterium]|jgi:RNase P/RNase MRP subunit p30|nr:hypothetical protein [Bacteroidales bacterium]HNZ42762.1 hypothetical protein [Bacteroidales bacterium]HPB24932.1 hypothetical protein [Bacteroidales bacterium]HPI29896.1 hypothetical protein [Bacteroidales bacterium]HQN15778.1 hypothetical protein [Bacteroidales bacterium]